MAKTAEAAASRPEERKKLKAAAPLLNDLQRGQLVEARYGYGNTWYKGRVEEAHACAGASTKYTIAWCGDDDGIFFDCEKGTWLLFRWAMRMLETPWVEFRHRLD